MAATHAARRALAALRGRRRAGGAQRPRHPRRLGGPVRRLPRARRSPPRCTAGSGSASAPRRTGSARWPTPGVGPRLEDGPRGRFVELGGQRADRRPAGARAAADGDRDGGPRATGATCPSTRPGLAAAFPDASGRVVVFLHGLCENESYWNRGRERAGTTYGEMLADEGWTPVFLRANTGLGLRENGVALSALMQRLVDAWPVPVTRVALVGHSMGGLIVRAAGAVASDQPTSRGPTSSPTSSRSARRTSARRSRAASGTAAGGSGGCRRPRRSAGSSTGARSACTTWWPASPRTCRRCRTRATGWSPPR